ncbi:MAG: hypothetical protein LQ339_006437 [Xanthoria mediterranea]|nr:MAG: hypothetical protein LQ339_006437 [Xanthoria mediterranea]
MAHCKMNTNRYMQKQCDGCWKINTPPRNLDESQAIKTHDTLSELERCALKGCVSCRVIRRALWLSHLTWQEAQKLSQDYQSFLVAIQFRQSTLRVLLAREGAAVVRTTVSYTDGNIGDVSLSRSPDNIYAEAISWYKDCNISSHSECFHLKWSNRNPANLVHAAEGSANYRLIDTSQTKHLREYAALSYQWGNTEANRPAKTTRENREQRRRGSPIAELPQTIQDAIRIAQKLGLEYVWVDTMCIPSGADWNHEASRMHEIYGNARITLCACASEVSTDGMLHEREAWKFKSETCQLDNHRFLANLDMPLNEMRIRSPLFSRGWTLQEERLSPRILYICGQRMFWSCCGGQRTELGRASGTARREYEIPEEDANLRDPQQFLKDRYHRKAEEMHEQWLDIVMAYTRRGMHDSDDRFRAISGLAAQYLTLYCDEDNKVVGQEYLAGLWRTTMAQELAWSMPEGEPKRPDDLGLFHRAPSWSWVSVPLESTIVMQHTTNAKPWDEKNFQVLQEGAPAEDALSTAKRGALVKSLEVQGHLRHFIGPRSQLICWDKIKSRSGRADEYDTSKFPSERVHCREPKSGKILTLEPHVKAIVGQLDYAYPDQDSPGPWHFVADDALKDLYCLQVGTSSMLLLEKTTYSAADGSENKLSSLPAYRRVGVCNNFDEMFFTRAPLARIVLV